MRKDLVEATLKSIDAMIESELESTAVGRYGRIRFLCDTAGNLLQRSLTRVDGVVDLDNEPELVEDDGAVRFQPGQRNAGTDLGDLTREMIAAISTMSKPRALPIPFTSPTDELMRLLDLRERLTACGRSTANVDKKIATVEASFDKEPIASLVELAPSEPMQRPLDNLGEPSRCCHGYVDCPDCGERICP
jgi:hypothetical protein